MLYSVEKEQHPFYVKSNWNPLVQQSVALEGYLEEVSLSLAGINLTKPKTNLPPAECESLKAQKAQSDVKKRINFPILFRNEETPLFSPCGGCNELELELQPTNPKQSGIGTRSRIQNECFSELEHRPELN